MPIRKTSKNISTVHRAWLYSLVYTSRFSAFLILVLFLSFLIQPVSKAFANQEEVEAPPEPVSITAKDVQMELGGEVDVSSGPALGGQLFDEVNVPEAEDVLIIDEFGTSENTADEEESSGELTVPSEGDETIEDESAADLPVEDSATEEVDSNDNPTNDQNENTDTVSASSSTQEISESQFLITNENFYQFSKQSCIAVGSGAFHCTRNNQDEINAQSIVYAAVSDTGNYEIFLKTSRGTDKQITNNEFEDTAPFYDAESMRVVWQRLINGRQQIILYDVRKNEETQLTFSRTNNMEPKVSGAGIVWQAWDGDDWEIMYFDGTYTDQITLNDSNDVAPVIKDNYILWSVLGGSEQQARVYSLDTKETISIIGHEGGSIENPRFVLVYDTKFDNGDVVTQGFDPLTGLSAPIASQPAPIPVDIPDSDSTGETRALIQNKPSQKDDNDLIDIDTDPNNDNPVASTTDDGTLDLVTMSSTTTLDAAIDLPILQFELTEYDLVVPFASTSESSTQ